ncbi:MAG TPA: hypothetical protein VN878_06435 [Usitatibacter sp.]|nr:hypothetical protein [Usitatibacter sp.]
MNQIKVAGEFLANDVSRELEGPENAALGDTEIRTLRDLELMLAGGGSDGMPCW